MADMRDLGSRAARRKGSSPFPRTIQCGSSSAVEHRLAKARVAGSNPVFRSICRGDRAPRFLHGLDTVPGRVIMSLFVTGIEEELHNNASGITAVTEFSRKGFRHH